MLVQLRASRYIMLNLTSLLSENCWKLIFLAWRLTYTERFGFMTCDCWNALCNRRTTNAVPYSNDDGDVDEGNVTWVWLRLACNTHFHCLMHSCQVRQGNPSLEGKLWRVDPCPLVKGNQQPQILQLNAATAVMSNGSAAAAVGLNSVNTTDSSQLLEL